MRYDVGRFRRPMRRSTEGQLMSLISLGDGSTLTLDFTTGVLDPLLTFTRSGTATFINASGLLATASTNTPRFDHDPTTGSPRGLLIEGSATNRLFQSSAFSTSPWSSSGYDFTGTGYTSPDGTTNALRWTILSGSQFPSNVQVCSNVTSTSVTLSVWWRNGNHTNSTGNNLRRIAVRNATTSSILLDVNIVNPASTPSLTYNTGSTGASITPFNDGWYRIVLTVTSGITSGNNIQAYIGGLGGGFTGAGEYCYWWGAQLEDGSGASSYIPTGASQGTRNPDYCVMDGISSFFTSQSSLTMLIDATPRFQSGFPTLWRLTDAGSGNSYELYYTSSGANNTYATKVAVGFVSSGESNFATSIAQDTRQIMGYAIASGVGFRSRNGASASAQIPTSLPSTALTRLGIGSSGISSNPATAHIRRIKYWPYAMTQDQLNGVTTP